ncbi:MAG: hypothetical protein CME36_09650 [unclassified Hahellaceae]|nr:hypothetical protein [Hahellaceae bacterium]
MFNLEWRDVPTQTTTAVPNLSGTTHELTNLSPGADYEFRVQQVDGSTVSAWSAWKSFRTDGETAVIIDVGVIVGNSVKVPTRARRFIVNYV